MTISQDKICNAAHAEAWSMCLWGNPKADVVCGKCQRPFATRTYYPFNRGKPDESTVANCPHCGMWNKLGFIYA